MSNHNLIFTGMPIGLIQQAPAQDLSITQPGMLGRVDRHAWESWEEEMISPDPALRVRVFELVLHAKVRTELTYSRHRSQLNPPPHL